MSTFASLTRDFSLGPIITCLGSSFVFNDFPPETVMRTRYRTTVLAALLPLVVVGVGCNLVKAKAAFKDGNKLYKEENYRKAVAEYEMAVAAQAGLRRGALLPGELRPVAVPSRQGRGREQDAPRQGGRALREVAGDEQERQPAAPAAPRQLARRAHRDLRGACRSRTTKRRSATRSSSSRTTRTTPRTSTRWRTSTRSSAALTRPSRRTRRRRSSTPTTRRPAARSRPSTTSRYGTSRAAPGSKARARAPAA